MRKRTEGFLFDIHEGNDSVVLWIYGKDGALLRLEADFHLRIYARSQREPLRALGSELLRRGLVRCFRLTEGVEFWSGKTIEVGEYVLSHYEDQRRVVDRLASAFGEAALYNADLAVPQYYLYSSDIFPLCRLEVEYEGNRVHHVHCLSPPEETNYPVPELRIVELKLSQSKFVPIDKGNNLIFYYDHRSYEVKPRTWRELIESVNDTLEKMDPDVILSDHGDETIFPFLIQVSKRERMSLVLDRDRIPTERAVVSDGRSYVSYGRVIYKPPSYVCFGRWHIDLSNSFIVAETGLDGLIELSRLARLPPQKVARTSPGTAMSSIECYQAFKRNILIPYQKAEPEKYKTAWDLLLGDKGGLVYMQPVGLIENVAEIDYASMYPTVMMKKNLSPETVRCSCCSNTNVPEINYNVCEKREGLLPLALRPILERRRTYKHLKKNSRGAPRELYDRRQHALKWLLVTAFGFTGYRNARFGRIECHEATTAWGRELLLTAKEIAEARGFRLLHALTDSLWITKPLLSEEELTSLCQQITRITDIEMSLEGMYRWIVFLPSRENSRRGVACRYFGRLHDKEVKARGLISRRHDTPDFVREAQSALLYLLGQAETLREYKEKAQQARLLVEGWLEDLDNGRVPTIDLLITRRLSKEPRAYKVRTMTVEAVRQLKRGGYTLHPGEPVTYLVVNEKNKRPSKRTDNAQHESSRVLSEAFLEDGISYDAEYYKKLLRQAADEVLSV